jgi:hypothetical protein
VLPCAQRGNPAVKNYPTWDCLSGLAFCNREGVLQCPEAVGRYRLLVAERRHSSGIDNQQLLPNWSHSAAKPER